MNSKRIKCYAIIFIITLILIPNNAVAKTKNYKKECLGTLDLQWKEVVVEEEKKIDDPLDAETNNVILTITEQTEGRDWNVYSGVREIDNTAEFFGDIDKGDKNKPRDLLSDITSGFEKLNSTTPYTKEISFPKTETNFVAVFIKLDKDFDMTVKDEKGDDKIITCHTGDFKITGDKITIENKDPKKGATGRYETYKISADEDDIVHNINYEKKACGIMRDGIYSNKGKRNEDNDISATDIGDYTAKASKYFPYCFNYEAAGISNPNIEFSNKTINSIKKDFIKYYKDVSQVVKIASSDADKNKYETLKNEYISNYKKLEVKGGKNGNPYETEVSDLLKCSEDINSEGNVSTYWAEKEILNNTYCTVSCMEKFGVTYDPPQAIKAGLCFSYKVTVKSTVNCKTEIKSNIWPEKKINACKFKALCDIGDNQAGPNDEFDSCIQDCDGGKYSQSCINKCYNKVYENKKSNTTTTKKSNSSKKLISNSTGKVLRLGNASDPYEVYKYEDENKDKEVEFNLRDNCSTLANLNKNIDLCVEGFKEAKNNNSLGVYYQKTKEGQIVNKKKWYWGHDDFKDDVKDATDEDVTADFSASSDRSKGVNSIVESVKRAAPYYLRTLESTKTFLRSFFGEGYRSGKIYNVDNDGIKRQTTFNCRENCWFKVSGGDDCVKTDEDVRTLYLNELKSKQAQIDECIKASKDSCSTTTAQFKIGADNGKDTDYMKSGTNKSGNSSEEIDNKGTLTDDNYNIFTKLPSDKDMYGINGKCYDKKDGDDRLTNIYGNLYEHQYKTTITLPNSGLDYKTGKKVICGKNANTCIQKDMYCTNFNDISVNQNWWYRKLIYNSNESSNIDGICNENTSYLNSTDIDYNIKSNVTDFGKFNWKVSVNCFYSLYNKAPESYTTKSKCTKTVLNKVIRAVDPKDPFNAEDISKTREPGYNWKSEATNKDKDPDVQLKGYNTDPQDYLKEFTAKAENNTLYYDSEVDFEANIGPSEINELKKYNNNIGKFNIGELEDFERYERVGNSDLYYYNSELLKDLSGKTMNGNSSLKIIRKTDPGINNRK